MIIPFLENNQLFNSPKFHLWELLNNNFDVTCCFLIHYVDWHSIHNFIWHNHYFKNMKKVNLFVAGLLFSGAAMAQSNQATATMTGDNNTTTIDQVGNAHESYVTIGSSNWGSGYSDGNTVDVDQNSGASSLATVDVLGSTNNITVGQIGSDHEADIDLSLSSPSNLASDNTVSVQQSGGNNNYLKAGTKGGDNNIFTSDQFGNDNFHRVSFNGSDNTISINVTGDANRGDWEISTGYPPNADFNSLTLTQDGYNNYATGEIEGDYNTVSVTQVGDQNRVGTSWYTQDGVDILGDYNTTTIGQDGDFNIAEVNQTGDYHNATITQTGTSNMADIDQSGNLHIGVISQDGVGNTSYINQSN